MCCRGSCPQPVSYRDEGSSSLLLITCIYLYKCVYIYSNRSCALNQAPYWQYRHDPLLIGSFLRVCGNEVQGIIVSHSLTGTMLMRWIGSQDPSSINVRSGYYLRGSHVHLLIVETIDRWSILGIADPRVYVTNAAGRSLDE